MNQSSKVTVIIPTFNRAHFLSESIESVLRQTIQPYQLIVVNDGSTDETDEIIASYGNQIKSINKTNGGKPSAINSALPLVEGDYIWIFDDDDLACHDALERHVKALQNNPDAGWTYSSFYWCHSPNNSPYLCVDSGKPVRWFEPREYFFELLLSCYVGNPCAVVRTSVQKLAGPYAADLTRSEDWEMALRWALLRPGTRLLPDEKPTFYRRMHSGLRGKEGDLFDYSENVMRSREAERIIIKRLSSVLALHHFLPNDLWNSPLTPELKKTAHLRRFVLYCAKGMWRESAEALSDLNRLTAEGEILPANELRYLRRVCAQPAVIEEMSRDSDIVFLAHALLQNHIPGIQNTLCLGIVQHLRESLRKPSEAGPIKCMKAMLRTLGTAGTAASLGQRAYQKLRALS